MFKNLEWACEYCESMNQYDNTHCSSCGAPRSLDTEFKSTIIPKEEKSFTENVEDLAEGMSTLKDAANAFARGIADSGMLPQAAQFIQRGNTIKSKWQRFKRKLRNCLIIAFIIIIVIIVISIIK